MTALDVARPAAARVAARVAAARHDERGQSLLEAMIVISVAAMLALPILAWVVTGVRVGNRVEQISSSIRAQNLLTSYLERDVTGALSTNTGGTDCSGGSSAGGTVLITLPQGANETRVVYSVAGTGTETAIWRRVCGAAGLAAELPVVEHVVQPAAGWAAVVSCPKRPATLGTDCGRQVEMSVEVIGRELVTVAAVRRIGDGS